MSNSDPPTLKQGNSLFYPSLCNKGILKVNDLLDDFGHFMKWASAKLKFDLKEQDAILWLSVLDSIPSQWKRKVKSHNMKSLMTCLLVLL